MQLRASEKLLMQRGNPYFCQSPHLKCNQRHSGGSWNLNQHQNSRREGPGVLYCTRPAGEALISIANSINSGRGVLFISLKKKIVEGEKKGKLKECGYFHGSSKIIHPSVMKSRLDQKVGERRNGAELSIWKQTRIVPSRCSLEPPESRASLFALSPGNVTVINDCYLNDCLFCHKRTPMWLRKAFRSAAIFIYVFSSSFFFPPPAFSNFMFQLWLGRRISRSYQKSLAYFNHDWDVPIDVG